MSSKLVERRLNDFRRRCTKDGDAALELACYAALPVALNPELLHFLRINFFFDPPKQLPYTVEFEFFTSALCRAIDVELYEIEPETRKELLKRLMKKKNAPQRIRDVATLLWQYVEYHSPWEDRVELERAQQLTALHFLNHKKAQEWLDKANADNSQNGGGQEWFIAMGEEINKLSRVQPFLPPETPPPINTNMNDFLQKIIDQVAEFDSIFIFDLKEGLPLYCVNKDPKMHDLLFDNNNDVGIALEGFDELNPLQDALNSFGSATKYGSLQYSIFKLDDGNLMVYFHDLPDTRVAIIFLGLSKTGSLGAFINSGKAYINEIKRQIPNQ